MSKTAHTPGPWKWQSEDECLVGPDQVVMRQDDEGRKTFADYPDGTTQANARLIAAAPDLLEALDGCVADLERHARSEFEGVWFESDFESLLSPYRAAIARAKGGE